MNRNSRSLQGRLFCLEIALISLAMSACTPRIVTPPFGSISDISLTPFTPDQFSYASGEVSTAAALATDSDGNLYAVGVGVDSFGLDHWIVREYTQGSWSTIDDYVYASGQSSAALAVAVDSSGNVYVVGMGTDSSAVDHWIVREYTGGSWSTIDDYLNTAGYNSEATSVAIDASGDVYVAGAGATGPFGDPVCWIVREYSSGSWSIVDSFDNAGNMAEAMAIQIAPSGNIYAAGIVYDSSFYGYWFLREFTAGSWSTIDDYQYSSNQEAMAKAIAIDSNENVYVLGVAEDSSSLAHWLTRECTGGSCANVDDYLYLGGQTILPESLAIDGSGNVYAAGVGVDTSSVMHWLIREASGGSWSLLQDYQLVAGQSSAAAGLLWDPYFGEVLACGEANTASDAFWVVQSVP